jgi:excisionase family DNA binding protein
MVRTAQSSLDTVIEGDRLMTIHEVAEYCGIHRAGVYRLMDKQLIPYVIVGARRRVRHSDLLRYLNRPEAAS